MRTPLRKLRKDVKGFIEEINSNSSFSNAHDQARDDGATNALNWVLNEIQILKEEPAKPKKTKASKQFRAIEDAVAELQTNYPLLANKVENALRNQPSGSSSRVDSLQMRLAEGMGAIEKLNERWAALESKYPEDFGSNADGLDTANTRIDGLQDDTNRRDASVILLTERIARLEGLAEGTDLRIADVERAQPLELRLRSAIDKLDAKSSSRPDYAFGFCEGCGVHVAFEEGAFLLEGGIRCSDCATKNSTEQHPSRNGAILTCEGCGVAITFPKGATLPPIRPLCNSCLTEKSNHKTQGEP